MNVPGSAYDIPGSRMPLYQQMDSLTLDWILATGKNLFGIKPEPMHLHRALAAYTHLVESQASFFTNHRIAEGIHGLRHCFRVSLLAGHMYLEQLGNDPDYLVSLLVAGSLHDCRRQNDKTDPEHGRRSAEWFRSHVSSVTSSYGHVSLNDMQVELISTAIAYHDVPDEEIQESMSESCRLAINVIKTADALDRYRLSKQRWWINDDFLALKPDIELKQKAWSFVCQSEALYLEKTDSVEALRQLLNECRFDV